MLSLSLLEKPYQRNDAWMWKLWKNGHLPLQLTNIAHCEKFHYELGTQPICFIYIFKCPLSKNFSNFNSGRC